MRDHSSEGVVHVERVRPLLSSLSSPSPPPYSSIYSLHSRRPIYSASCHNIHNEIIHPNKKEGNEEWNRGSRQASFKAAIHNSQSTTQHKLSSQGECMPRPSRPKSYVLATSTSFEVKREKGDKRRDSSQQRTPTSPLLFRREIDSNGSCQVNDSTTWSSSLSSHLGHSQLDHGLSRADDSGSALRLQRFFALFSTTNEERPKQGVSRKEKSKKGNGRVKGTSPSSHSLAAKSVEKQGALLHQQLPLGESIGAKKVCRNTNWNQCWAVLSGTRLLLCRQLASFISDDGQKMLSIPPDALSLDLEGAIADIAYEYAKVQEEHMFIIRLVTQMRSEHLLRCSRESEMLEWINRVHEASASSSSLLPLPNHDRRELESSESGSSNTNRLIMHRYKVKASALGSPLSWKRGSQEGSSSSSSVPSSSRKTKNEDGGTPKTNRRWAKKGGKDKKSHDSLDGQRPGPSNSQQCLSLGVRLSECTTSGDGDLVPLLVRRCVSVVMDQGMDIIGIYRIPGNTAAVNQLKDALNGGIESVDLSDPRWKDVNVVSSLLKMFLRKLPEPLLTDKLYPFFIDANRITNHHQRLHKMRNLVRKLPKSHYETLKFLSSHLHEVTCHSEVNKMESRNLALMFGPSIVRPSDDSMATMVTHMSDQCRIVETFVNYHEWIFKEDGASDEPVPEKRVNEADEREGKGGLETPHPAVSTASFNDMHSLIIRANERQAEEMMRENDKGKMKNILNVRRSSKKDKWKGKGGVDWGMASHSSLSSSALTSPSPISAPSRTTLPSDRLPATHAPFQERDIDAEIASRANVVGGNEEESGGRRRTMEGEKGEEKEGRGEGTREGVVLTSRSEGDVEKRRQQLQDMCCARRIFIAGSEAAANDSLCESRAAVDALTSHTAHLNQAASPALEVYSAETREKIRRMQLLGTGAWRKVEKPTSPSREDDISWTSDYSTTSSAPPTHPIRLIVASTDHLGPVYSDYASSDPSPCILNTKGDESTVEKKEEKMERKTVRRPDNLRLSTKRKKKGEDKGRRHTLAFTNTILEPKSSALSSVLRIFGLVKGKSLPDVRGDLSPPPSPSSPSPQSHTSPYELTPASGDEEL